MIENIKAIAVFLLVFAFCSNGYLAMEDIVPAIKEAYWYLLLFGMTAIFILLTPMEALANIPKSAFIWIILFLISTTIAYIFSSQSSEVQRITIILIKAISVFISMFVLITSPKVLKAAFYSLILVILVGSGVNATEFFTDAISWSDIPGRSAGWYYNANKSGKFLVLSLIFASIITPKKFLWPLIAITTVGVLLTFSRGTWVQLFIVIVGISLIRTAPAGEKLNLLNIKPSSFIAMVMGGFVAAFLLITLFSGQAYQYVQDTPLEEYLSKDTIGRMSGDFQDDSANERKEVLFGAIKAGLNQPLIGKGLAYTYEWEHSVGPHNDYALLFAERGILGLILYLAVIGIIWFTGSRHAKLYAMVLAFSSIATHNTLEQPATYVFLALAFLHKDGLFDPPASTNTT